ncbi:hypothetical protein CRG98_032326 [Punica granatum]|uniref:Uncharacterized protein n=1 Tax=Punica granatum TaxID=22663 RepID=A0A2I0IUE4_PUNGR|nr:hypothetical protein CRG98_032326 [Punica granatum]
MHVRGARCTGRAAGVHGRRAGRAAGVRGGSQRTAVRAGALLCTRVGGWTRERAATGALFTREHDLRPK